MKRVPIGVSSADLPPSRSLSRPQVRLQLGATGGPFGVDAGIIKNDGFGALYTVRARSLISAPHRVA